MLRIPPKVLTHNKTTTTNPRRFISNVAFIGLGNMGLPMAKNLSKHTKHLFTYDIKTVLQSHDFQHTSCSTIKDVVGNCSAAITMLPRGEIVQEVYLGKDGILKHAPKNCLLIDCSTIEPKRTKHLAQQIVQQGKCRFLDAPVSGGVVGATNATLTFMVGGREDDLNVAKPILEKMGQKVLYCGGPGSGQIAKLCNNLILGATMVATAEGLNLGIKMGLDAKVLTSIVNSSSGYSWSSQVYNPVPGVIDNLPASKNYDGGFSCNLMAKDLGLAAEIGVECGAPLPLGAVAHQLFRTIIAHGNGDKDFAIIYKFLKGLDM